MASAPGGIILLLLLGIKQAPAQNTNWANVTPTDNNSFRMSKIAEPACPKFTPPPTRQPPPSILFVVNFHYKIHATINAKHVILHQIMQHYYQTPFDVIFISPGDDRPGFIGNGLPDNGFLSYHSLTVAHRRYPNYSGYMLVNDDVILVQHHFFNIDWTLPLGFGGLDPAVCLVGGKHWPWADEYCPRAIKAFRPTETTSRTIYRSQADIFYVPAPYLSTWATWANAFVTNNVFLEIAVPTILNAIARCHYASTKVCTDWNYSTRPSLWQKFPLDNHCAAYHPIKVLSSPIIAATIAAKLKQLAHPYPRIHYSTADHILYTPR